MKQRNDIAIASILLGLSCECLYLLFGASFSQLCWPGFFFIGIGTMGLVWTEVIPLLEKRAEILGRHKKKSLKNE